MLTTKEDISTLIRKMKKICILIGLNWEKVVSMQNCRLQKLVNDILKMMLSLRNATRKWLIKITNSIRSIHLVFVKNFLYNEHTKLFFFVGFKLQSKSDCLILFVFFIDSPSSGNLIEIIFYQKRFLSDSMSLHKPNLIIGECFAF